ncbi:MAG TPA: thiopeptide-type bacteriocin biosynthesis protein [Streptosporangiaceae bacterium]|nr:thiopeptide-type bacteriocin biosynthesis protein [Streptosporangiaceae bacterium]
MWRALHIYLHRPIDQVDQVITSCLAPLATGLIAEGKASSWFFIRYAEGGPHLRLRLADADDATVDQAAGRIRDHLAALPPAEQFDADEFYTQAGHGPQAAKRFGWHADATVVEQPYLPEVDRYGGQEAIGLAETLFRQSSEVAVTVLNGTPRAGLLARAVDLLLAVVHTLEIEPAQAAIWLRGYFYAWEFIAEAPATDAAAVRALAERDLVADGSPWPRRSERIASALRQPRSAYQAWAEAVSKTEAALLALAEADRLTDDPRRILLSQLHMLHNRLGLSITEEQYLCWLVSLILIRASTGVTGPAFYGPEAEAAERAYHERGKYLPTLLDNGQLPEVAAPRRSSALPLPESRSLALVTDDSMLPQPLRTALKARTSSQRTFGGPLSAEQLGTLLTWAAGVRDRIEVEGDGQLYRLHRRTYPSAGGRYPVSVRLLIYRVDGIPPGTYHYDPIGSRLQRLGAVPAKRDLERSTPWFGQRSLQPIDISNVPAVLLLTGALGMMRGGYGVRGYRFVMLEAGHLAQNLALCCASMGLGTVTIGGFFDDATAQLARLDSLDEAVIYLFPLGTASRVT